MKKVLKITALVLLLLIGFAFAAPFLFKGKIISIAKSQINKNLNAKVDFSDVDISLFRHFPKLAVALEGLQVTGVDEFAADTLIAAKRIDVALNLMSVISGSNMKIYSITVDDPRIHAIVHKNGHANWSITKPDSSQETSTAASQPFKMELQHYSINNAYISYVDETGNMSSEIFDLDHEGSGDFTSDLFTLQTKTSAAAVNFIYGAVPYLANTKASIDAAIQVDNKTSTYSFKTDKIALNDLGLNAEGFFQLVNDSTYKMDIAFKAPSTDFKNILSMIPAIYKKDFASIKTSGQALFSGFVKGTYDATHIPAYNINLDVKNGFFQYPDLPKPVKNINIALKVDNPDGVTDHTVVDIPQGHIEMDDAPFDFRLLLKNPVTDMFIDAGAKGKLDLGKIAQFVKLESGTRLNGLLQADVHAKGNVSAIEKQQYDKFSADGTVALNDFLYASKAYPGGVKLNNLLMTFNPKNVTVNNLSGEYLKTNFSANGAINNLLAYALKNKPLDGYLNVKADQINVNDWMGSMPADSPATTTAAAATPPFAVPANIDFTVNANADKVIYDKLDLQHLSGSMRIADETVKLSNLKADALDGTMIINGSYSTKTDKKKPDIAFTYDVKGLDVQKTFYAFNTVQKLMPIGKFLDGKLTSQMSLTGKLGDNMYPEMNSLSGDGNLLVLEGALKKFEPLNKLAQTLNVDQLKDIAVKDIKAYFSFKNGKVVVNPFHVKLKDIDMEVGGSHGFDQTMDYAMQIKLPRSMMGSQANALVNNLVTQVNSKGVPVKVSDVINLNVKMGGTITNPALKTDMKEALAGTANNLKQQASSFVQAQVDSAKQQLRDTAQAIKKQVVASAASELKKQLTGQKDTAAGAQPADTKKKVEEAGKGLFNSLLKKKKTDSSSSSR